MSYIKLIKHFYAPYYREINGIFNDISIFAHSAWSYE